MIMMSSDDSSTVMKEKGSNDETKDPDFPKKAKTSYDVIIIGAGPAGYTAGIYCSRACLLYTSPSPRDRQKSRMPSSA